MTREIVLVLMMTGVLALAALRKRQKLAEAKLKTGKKKVGRRPVRR
jgi:hypothetical protein